MLQLIKKDLLVSLKIRSLKAVILTCIVGLFLLSRLSFIFPTILPIIITYMVVMNTFYYDSLNNSESYILSLPNKREDIVYSKYILILLLLFLSNILVYIVFGIKPILLLRVMVLQDVVVSFYSVMISFSVIIPLIFKFGYRVIRNIGPFIISIISYIFIDRYSSLVLLDYNYGGDYFVYIFNKMVAFIMKYLNLVTHNSTKTSKEIYYILLLLIILFIFLYSMFISLKFYLKKDIE